MTPFFPLSSSAMVPQASYILSHNRASLGPTILKLLNDQKMLSLPCTQLFCPRNQAPFLQVGSGLSKKNTLMLSFQLVTCLLRSLAMFQCFDLAQFIFLIAFSSFLHLYLGYFAYKRNISPPASQISSLHPSKLQLPI